MRFRTNTKLLGLSTLVIMLLSLLAACGAAPTATPAQTTAAPTTAPAATTAAPTTVSATTAPATTNAPTRAATTAPVATPTSSAARPTVTGTARAVPAPTFPPNSAANLPTPSAPRPAINLLDKADPLLIDLIDLFNSTQGTEAVKLKAAREFAEDLEVLYEDQDEIGFDVDVVSKADAKKVTDKITAMGGFVDDEIEIEGYTIILAAVPLKVFLTYQNATTKNNFLKELCEMKEVKLVNLPFDYEVEGLLGLPPTLEALKQLGQEAKNEGVKILGADKWQAAGIKGNGVTIGIIDSGYKFIDQLKGTYLPNDFTVTDFAKQIFGENSIDVGVHGTGVSEIIYSLAPEAKLIATSVRGSDAEFDAAIDFLVSQKVDFISVSMGNNSTAEDGNSPLSKKIEKVNKETGIVFFFASGNEGQEHYGGMFTPDDKGFHQFIPGVDRMAFGNPTDNPLQTTIILRWDEWLNGDVNPNATDFDLVIEDKDGKFLGTIDGDQRIRPPLETNAVQIPPQTVFYLKIKLKDGTNPPTKPVRVHIFLTGGIPPQFITPVMTVGTNADSRGAVAVGAIDPPDGTAIADYSSQGPLSDGRVKPDISAPGGVKSAAYEANGGKGIFNGTSAATPQVSGLAGLIKSGNPSLTSMQVVQVLQENAKMPSGLAVPNTVYGYGIADLSSLTPGAVQPKGNLPPMPAPNTNPDMPLLVIQLYPAPVPNP